MENKRRLIQANKEALAARFMKEHQEKKATPPIPKPPSPLATDFAASYGIQQKFRISEAEDV